MRLFRAPLFVAALLSAGPTLAGGFQVNLASQKNNGMGHVGTGLALDQGSIFFNPGAMTFVRDRGVVIGASATIGRSAFRDGVTNQVYKFKHETSTPFQLYAGFGPQEGKWRAGLGIYTPFGSTLNYGSDWPGHYSLTNIRLFAGFIQPTVSYQITDWLGIGGGFVYALGYVKLEKDLPISTTKPEQANITLESDGVATGTGYNVGIFLQPTKVLSVGISYRSKVDMKVKDGKVQTANLPDNTPNANAQLGFKGTKFDATLPLPATLSIGVGLKPTEKLTIGADFNYVFWSAYKSLRFDFNDNIGGTLFSESKRDFKDGWVARIGADYRVADMLSVRAGTYFDKSPVRDGYVTPETPDNDRLAGTAGLTFHAGEKVDIDLSYQYIDVRKRSQTPEDLVKNGTTDRPAGTYHTALNIVGGGVSLKF